MNTTLLFGFSSQEILLILLIILLLFGAKKLPELARGLGRSMGEFKKGREEGESGKTAESKAEPKEPGKPA